VFLNEINTMPGFTQISMYPKLWAASGLSFSELVTRIAELGLQRFEERARNQTSFTAE
jgi:D-alanine-D-alanine ligase